MITKKIHLIWVSWCGQNYPEKYQTFVDNLIKNNPDYQIKFWDYQSIEKLIKQKYKHYHHFYANLPSLKLKHHIARFAIVAEYGGIYFDFDHLTHFNSNLDHILKDQELILISKQGQISCSTFAAKPRHPFILAWLKQMYNNLQHNDLHTKEKISSTVGCNGFNEYYIESGIGDKCRIIEIANQNQRTLKGGHWTDPDPSDNIDQSTVFIVYVSLFIIVLMFIFAVVRKN